MWVEFIILKILVMSYMTSSSLPQASSRRNRYEVPYEPRTRNDTDNTYDPDERFDDYGINQQSENDEPISRRQQGFNCFFFFNSFELL